MGGPIGVAYAGLPEPPNTAAKALIAKANHLAALGKIDQAIACYQSLVRLDSLNNSPNLANDINSLAELYLKRSDWRERSEDDQIALRLLNQALACEKASKPSGAGASTMADIGLAEDHLGEYDASRRSLLQAFDTQLQRGDRQGQGQTLDRLGQTYLDQDSPDPKQAVSFLNRAFAVQRAIGDNPGEVESLLLLGSALTASDPALARKDIVHAQALAAKHEEIDQEARALLVLGNIEISGYDNASAITHLQKAAILADIAGDLQTEADSDYTASYASGMSGLGLQGVHNALLCAGIARQLCDQTLELRAWTMAGNNEDDLSNFAGALIYYNRALALARKIADSPSGDPGDKRYLGEVLGDMGNPYQYLGEWQLAADYHRQSADLSLKCRDYTQYAVSLNSLGRDYRNLSEYKEALEFYRQSLAALPSIAAAQRPSYETTFLANIGELYWLLGRYTDAASTLTEAIDLAKQTFQPETQMWALVNLGNVYLDQKRYDRATNLFNQSLVLANQIGDQRAIGYCFCQLMSDYQKQKKPGIAIFYGKKSIDTYQSIRQSIRGLDRGSRDAFISSNTNTYRTLAELLISHGRISEAEQVLAMLKEQEFFDYLHGDEGESRAIGIVLALTPEEAEWQNRYDRVASEITSSATLRQALLEKKKRADQSAESFSEQDTRRLAEANREWQAANVHFGEFEQQIAKAFGASAESPNSAKDVSTAAHLERSVSADTLAIYTLVAPDKLYLVLVAPPAHGHGGYILAKSSAICSKQLYARVADFRAALIDPNRDPRPLAEDFFRLLIGPIQREIAKAHVQTLLFSLDDALRYVPPGAMVNPDNGRYLVQDYQIQLLDLVHAPSKSAAANPPHVLGMGTSRQIGDLPALPGVEEELREIVHESHENTGLISGKRLLNQDFTAAALYRELGQKRYRWVHIASHFLIEDTDTRSYLMLGDASKLSVAALRLQPHRFAGVELLTLSACDTAEEVKVGDGHEIDGFAALMQQLGARSVLASLWPVSDSVTPELMRSFYAYRTSHPRVPMAECLRQAQLALIDGAPAVTASKATRGFGPLKPVATSGPVYPNDPARPYAHPYYWAPFVLMGNGR